MKIGSMHVSKYSTPQCQTIVIKTDDGRTIEIDLRDKDSNFEPNSVRVKVHAYEWGHKLPTVVAFGHPFED